MVHFKILKLVVIAKTLNISSRARKPQSSNSLRKKIFEGKRKTKKWVFNFKQFLQSHHNYKKCSNFSAGKDHGQKYILKNKKIAAEVLPIKGMIIIPKSPHHEKKFRSYSGHLLPPSGDGIQKYLMGAYSNFSPQDFSIRFFLLFCFEQICIQVLDFILLYTWILQ